MTSNDNLSRELVAASFKRGRPGLLIAFSALSVIGAIAFMAGVLGDNPLRAWQAYLINFVFWTGLAFGAVLFSAIVIITGSKWGRPIKRLAESFGAFLPVAFILFWVLFFGKEILFSWVREPVPEKAAWLNAGFLFARDGAGLLLLIGIALAFIYRSAKRDLDAVSKGTATIPGQDEFGHSQTVLSTIYAISYAIILTLIAFDLIMSLDPHWYSTLFGAYYFISSFYVGLSALMILSALAVGRMGLGDFITKNQFYNLSKLILGFCIVTADFFYVHLMISWYGNLPEETHYVIARVLIEPWRTLSWIVLFGFFIIPFVVLLRRSIKMKPLAMLALCSLILVSMWLEKLLLVAPTIWKAGSIPIGPIEIAITAGFFGLVALSMLLFLRKFPILPVSDPIFHLSQVPEERDTMEVIT